MTVGEFEDAVVSSITDRLLKQQGHDTAVSPKRSALFSAIAEWRSQWHHADTNEVSTKELLYTQEQLKEAYEAGYANADYDFEAGEIYDP